MACVVLAYLLICARSGGRLNEIAVISRDANSLTAVMLVNRLLGSRRRSAVLYWAHELRLDAARYDRVCRHADGILATNGAILDDLAAAGADYRKPHVITYNGFPSSYLSPTPDRQSARQALGLDTTANLVVYTGKLGLGLVEIEHILNAAKLVPDATFILTGGKPAVVRHWRARCARADITNVLFTGFMHDPHRVRLYQRAGDVVVSYYTPQDHNVKHNLPQKIFEYMTSNAVIVSPAYPATAGVLTRANALLVPPSDPRALATGIATALRDRQMSARLAAHALHDAEQFTIEARGPAILSLVRQLQRERVG
jgi:glycosyltransferase involved in cell wall biosynthesis